MYREDLNNIPLDSIRGEAAISHTHYYWKCLTCDEIFESTLNSMIGSYNTSTKGCPYCSRMRLRKGESFAELHPELMDEYDPENIIDPGNVFPNNPTSVGWICRDCGHHWNATFALRHMGFGKCPVCNGLVLSPSKNSLKALYPHVARRWSKNNDVDANMIFPTSSIWAKWICETCFGEYSSSVGEVINGTDECPYCKGTKILPGFNSFAHNHPELLSELDDIANYLLPKNPDEISDFSTYKLWWTCNNNPKHKYQMSPRTRLMFQKRNREPCLYCRGQRRKLHHFVSYTKKP